ncbi:MAG: N-acetyltransferase [Bacteroidetes bacterium]|nr:N-acetyltransferase [Bacteroidota bacterium]
MFRILPPSSADIPHMLEIYRPFVEKSAVSFELQLPSLAEFKERVFSIKSKYPFMILRRDEEVLGYAYASSHRERPAYRWAVETSIYLAASARGKGLGRKLYTQLLDELYARHFGHAFGIITMPNTGSEKLHTACGFTKLCVHEKAGYKMNQWHDVLWMRKSLDESSEIAAEPIRDPWESEITFTIPG